MTTLLVAEHTNHALKETSLHTLTAALELGEPVDVLVAGDNCAAVEEQAAQLAGVARVRLAQNSAYQHPLSEQLAALVVELAADYSHIVAPASSMGKDLMPRVAALLDVAQLSDITAVVSADTFLRPIYAGNAVAKVQSLDEKKVITARPSAFAPAAQATTLAAIEAVDVAVSAVGTEFVSQELAQSERPELTSARIVVAGGRGVGSADNFALLEKLADKLGAAIGASRAAVDAGYVANDLQVGQTGKIVAPDLYIAVGISGAIQHLAGMKESKVIVAINSDEEAPIFQVADYGLVGDLFQLVPELEQKL